MPEPADEFIARGDAFLAQGRYREAIAAYDQALGLAPERRSALNNRGAALRRLGEDQAALACFERALVLYCDDVDIMLNFAAALRALGRLDEALGAYESVHALSPDDPRALLGRGDVMLQLDRPADAILAFDRATVLQPESVAAQHRLASALRRFGNPGPALAHFEQAYRLEPKRDFLLGDLILAGRQICDWREAESRLQSLVEAIAHGECASSPFPVLAVLDSPELQRRAAETYSAAIHPGSEGAAPFARRAAGARIRIGYFSGDFHNLPVAYLTAELFELHDRERFEVFGFSLGPPATDAMRMRLAAAFDHFIDLSRMDDRAAARRARELGIDIAIDLGGYTENSRTGIFAWRAAPVQASYLGYLGTMGADYYDYLLADRVIVPQADSRHYSEHIAWLPSYQVNDSRRRVADASLVRSDEGLPEHAFVFCCFNAPYKITPEAFERWMRILSACQGSVLWLFSGAAPVSDNLRREAAARGIDPGRLIFAPRRDHAEYLARYRLADLFLDTLPYNAGTTASDALWAGVPVLTLCGQSFAARVAASLLHAAGLPELVTHTPEEYVALATALASEPDRLAALRARLAAGRDTCALFDSRGFTKTLESAYLTMQQRHEAGLAPENFDA
jgi:predicted O-linked N-acetylglucosamine transferase (SPINDLY family)